MATLDGFIYLVAPYLKGCSEAAMINALRNSSIRFCTETWIARETATPISAIAGQDTYTLAASSGLEPVGVISLRYDNVELDKTTEEKLDQFDSGWRSASSGMPTAFMMDSPDVIWLNRAPAVAVSNGIRVRMAVRPTDTSAEVPDILYNDWRKTIMHGALEELLEMPDKSWSDPKMSAWHGRRQVFGLQSAKARARMGHQTTPPSVQPRSWT